MVLKYRKSILTLAKRKHEGLSARPLGLGRRSSPAQGPSRVAGLAKNPPSLEKIETPRRIATVAKNRSQIENAGHQRQILARRVLAYAETQSPASELENRSGAAL